MQRFIGTKLIKATPMSRLDYHHYQGWDVPSEDDEAGMLVEYIDGGKPNHPDHKGYISWSPLDVFNRAYRPVDGMTFGQAIEAMKAGKKVARSGWNGKGMWVWLCDCKGEPWTSKEGATYTRQSYIYMKTAQGTVVPWLASQSDMIEEDWMIVE